MAYLLENNTSKINEDVLRRKEYYQYDLPEDWHDHSDETIIPRFLISKNLVSETKPKKSALNRLPGAP